MKNKFSGLIIVFFTMIILPTEFIYAQHFIKIEQGLNFKFYTQDPININVSNQDYSLHSNQAFSYEFGYFVKTSKRIFVETGLKTGSYSNSFTVNINDQINNFEDYFTYRNLDVFYTKLPFYVGYRFKIEELAFQIKAGFNILLLKRGSISSGISTTTTDYLNSKINLNTSNDLIRSRTISIGYAHTIFRKSILLTEITVDFYKQKFGDTFFEVYPNDSRAQSHSSALIDRQNVSLDFSFVF